MLYSHDLDFSFSGLKTAVLYKLKAQREITDSLREEVACAFEDAAVEVLINKTYRALETFPETKTLIVAGGVSANIYLREKLEDFRKQFPSLSIYLPEKLLTTDNAIMIGIASFVSVTLRPEILSYPQPLVAQGNLSISSLSGSR